VRGPRPAFHAAASELLLFVTSETTLARKSQAPELLILVPLTNSPIHLPPLRESTVLTSAPDGGFCSFLDFYGEF